MGVILAIGLTSLWPISIGLSLFVLYWNRKTIKVPDDKFALFVTLAIAGIIISTASYSTSPGSVIYYASAIALAPILIANAPTGRKLWIPLYVLSGIQIVWIISEYATGAIRPSGISDNGSALGIYGLMTLSPLNSIIISLSLSRTALLGMLLFAVLRNRKSIYILLALTFVVHIFVQLWVQPERLSIDGIGQALELRVDAVNGDLTDRKLSLFGYGYNGYVASTGRIQPHNIYILSVWELGILAVPFWILILILLWRSRNPYMLIPVILAINVDEWYTLTEGVFYLISFHLITKNLPSDLTNVARGLILKCIDGWRTTSVRN